MHTTACLPQNPKTIVQRSSLFFHTINLPYAYPLIPMLSIPSLTYIYRVPLRSPVFTKTPYIYCGLIPWAKNILYILQNWFPFTKSALHGSNPVPLTSAHLLCFTENRFAVRSSHLQKGLSKTWVLGPNSLLILDKLLNFVNFSSFLIFFHVRHSVLILHCCTYTCIV